MTEPNYKKRLRSGTGTAIEIEQTGHEVPATGFFTIEPGRYYVYANIMDETGGVTLHQKILDGDIIVNDGQRDLIPDRGIDYLKHPDRAWNIRFESDPDRLNGFVAKNAQEAIEEAQGQAIGNDLDTMQFGRNGNINNNTWLLNLNNIPSNSSPTVLAYDSLFRKISFSNDNNAANFTIQVWRSPETNPNAKTLVYSETFSGRGGHTATDQNIPIPEGQGISVRISNTGNPRPSDLVVTLWMRQG